MVIFYITNYDPNIYYSIPILVGSIHSAMRCPQGITSYKDGEVPFLGLSVSNETAHGNSGHFWYPKQWEKKQESHERKPGELVSKDWFLHGLVLVWLLLLKPRKNVENMDHSLKNAKQLYNLIHPPSRTGCLAPQHIRNSTLIKVCSGSIKMPHQLGGQQHLHFSINVRSTHLLWQNSGPRMFE